MSKRILFVCLLAASLLLCSLAFATDVEVLAPNVNFRSTPAGSVISRLSGGEVLPASEEVWADGQLWYHVVSPALGDGYVSGRFARPVYADGRIFDPAHPDDINYVTENVLAFFTSLWRWLYVHAYCYWDTEEEVCTFRMVDGIGDASVVQPIHRWEIAWMLLRYGLLVEDEETLSLANVDAPSDQKIATASAVLQRHFGTDDLWTIIIHSDLIHNGDAHTPQHQCSTADVLKLAEARQAVDAEFMDTKTGPAVQDLSGDSLLWYNPNGGSRYHADANCPSISPKYLPLTASFPIDQLGADAYVLLAPCNVCCAPFR